MDAEHRVTPLMATKFNEAGATLSPNGRWIAYSSDRPGVEEVYVRPFPGGVQLPLPLRCDATAMAVMGAGGSDGADAISF